MWRTTIHLRYFFLIIHFLFSYSSHLSCSSSRSLSPQNLYGTGGNSPTPPCPDLLMKSPTSFEPFDFQFFSTILGQESYSQLENYQSIENGFLQKESLIAYCNRHRPRETRLILHYFVYTRNITKQPQPFYTKQVITQWNLNSFEGFKLLVQEFLTNKGYHF